jgi:predicted O-linked N-acetylglucosamine transferase (SPINDLY family)
VDSVLGAQPDVLIYPEIGMDPMTAKLASLRLAPVQAAAWGHPETTGLPTMDYYLSAEDFEPPDARQHYTEQLVPLPHLGCCYHRLPITASEDGLDDLPIDRDIPVFLCPGMPFKYAPRHDRVFTEIARQAGRCQFVFFTHGSGSLSARLQQRLEQAFRESGMNPSDCLKFIPWLNKPAFHGLMKRVDVYLDTIGFSGFNTAIQAIECGLPVVTLDGRFLRGRLAGGIFRRMQLPDLIAADEEAWITMAVRLVQDTQYRRQVRQRIETARSVLFDDLAPIRALEEFLLASVKRR